MTGIWSLLILAAVPPAPTDPPPAEMAEAVEVFRCPFDEQTDRNYDGWPDGWRRRVGRGYPRYLKIGMVDSGDDSATGGDRCLRIELNGGAGAVFAPVININPQFSYLLTGRIKTVGLQHDVAFLSLTLLDDQHRPVARYQSDKLGTTQPWTAVRLGPVVPGDPQVASAVIGLHLEPAGGHDLFGEALFDDLRLVRLPRMTLDTDRPHHIYPLGREVAVTCQVSGILEPNPRLKMQLLNVHDQPLAEIERSLKEDQPTTEPPGKGPQQALAATVRWSVPITRPGFYRIRAMMFGGNQPLLKRQISVAVVARQPAATRGEFGWSISQRPLPLSLKDLADLLGYASVSWVKFPVWRGDQDGQWADRMAGWVERLSTAGIELVGVLDQPPGEARRQFGDGDRVPVASVFVEPELWQPLVDPVMTRLSMKVHWWQLGSDDDTSFIGLPDLVQRIVAVRQHLEQFGQEMHLGLSWQWLHALPAVDDPPWRYLSLVEHPPFTAQELQTHLASAASLPAERWVVLQPLDRDQYPLETRVRDLVTRMLAAKIGGADGIFVADPFDPQHGLMNPDGTPGPLLLPWRTAARVLAGKQLLGSIQLPGGSTNFILARGDETVMFVWNERPVRETVFLGHDVRQLDLWGNETTPPEQDGRQAIQVGPQPTILTGLNRAIALWRLSFAFDDRPLQSVFGRPQTTSFRLRNTFGQGVGGRMEMHTPEIWGPPKRFDLKLAAGGQMQQPFHVVLSSNARTGLQPVRIDFDITADQSYRFSVWRTIQVGLGDVIIDVHTRLDDQGHLIVTQDLINNTDQFVSFDCLLFVPNRRRQRVQVLNLGRGHNTQTYFLPDGQSLVGKTLWLRAEEIGGPRVLNYHIKVRR